MTAAAPTPPGLFVGRPTAGAPAGPPLALPLAVANRHGLIAGATGTGKTVSLRLLAEGFSQAGVPVFLADVKGDLGGLARPGEPRDFILKRAALVGAEPWQAAAAPVVFWDLFGALGHPVRTTISDMGPLLLSRLLDLSEAQEGVLNIVFRLADDQGLLLLDLKDLRALLAYLTEDDGKAAAAPYGTVAKASVGAIQRALLTLENQGGDRLFGEPALEIADLMRTTPDGRGVVNVLAAETLINRPRLYATFLLWLLAELFEDLPEVGDLERPRLVFFFDEAHLLFADAPKAVVEQVERVVRLIRSKGVGVYFCTQSPLDVPDTVLGQLGHRVQHALRAFTPRDQKAVRAVADTFRPNPAIDTAGAVQELAVGEALVSFLDPKGVPSPVERALIAPPASRLGVLDADERRAVMALSPHGTRFDREIDRDSAHEMLARRASGATLEPSPGGRDDSGDATFQAPSPWGTLPPVPDTAGNGRRGSVPSSSRTTSSSSGRRGDSLGETVAKEVARGVARSVGSSLGRSIIRGVLGAILKR